MSRSSIKTAFALGLVALLSLVAPKKACAEDVAFVPDAGGKGPALVITKANKTVGSTVTMVCALQQAGSGFTHNPAADSFLTKYADNGHTRLFVEPDGTTKLEEVGIGDRGDPREEQIIPPFGKHVVVALAPNGSVTKTECATQISNFMELLNCTHRKPASDAAAKIRALQQDLQNRCQRAYEGWLKAGAPKGGKITIDLAPKP